MNDECSHFKLQIVWHALTQAHFGWVDNTLLCPNSTNSKADEAGRSPR
jgi:hypothetical protein